MELIRASAPVAPLLSLAEAKEQLRVDSSDEDALIEAYIAAATEMLDARWGELGRALITQSWRLTLPGFPTGGRIDLPLPPVQSVTSVTYFDAENAERTLDSALYRLTIGEEGARVDLVNGATFPGTYDRPDAVSVRFVAGFGDAAADVPAGIRTAARLMIGHWYQRRESVTDKSMMAMPMGVRALLAKYRVVRGHI